MGEWHGSRPGFSFLNGKTREDGVYIFSIVPITAIVTPSFFIELDGLYKCVVSFLEPSRKITISGLKDKCGNHRPKSFIILDGKDVKTIEEEELKPVETLPRQAGGFIPCHLEIFPEHIPQFVRDLIMSIRSDFKEPERIS